MVSNRIKLLATANRTVVTGGLWEGRKEHCWRDIKLLLYKMKKFQRLLYNDVHIPNMTIHLKMAKMANFMLCVFDHNRGWVEGRRKKKETDRDRECS